MTIIRTGLKTVICAAGLLAAAASPSTAAARKPAQAAAAPPIQWVKSIPLDIAVKAARVAMEECRKNGKRGSYGVTDMDGNLKVLIIDDNANEVGQNALKTKMYTSMLLQETTWPMIVRSEQVYKMRGEINPEADVLDKVAPGGLVSPGAVALKVGGQFVGVLGVGGTAQGYGPGSEAKCAEKGGEWFDSVVNGK